MFFFGEFTSIEYFAIEYYLNWNLIDYYLTCRREITPVSGNKKVADQFALAWIPLGPDFSLTRGYD